MEKQFQNPKESSDYEYYKDRILKEQEKLKEFFAQYLPAEFHPKNIMDFCCGVANEEPLLHELYGDDISVISFDRSEHILQMAKDLNLERKSIIKLDISDINNHFQDESFDLLIGRNIPLNPNFRMDLSDEKYPDIWPQFLENLKKHLNENGYLLMTLAREDEFERAKELLNKSLYNIITQEKNSIIVPSDLIGIAGADIKDNYVILAKI